MLYTCSGDVGGGLRQMTVLQHGAANKYKRKNKLTICNWKMYEITKKQTCNESTWSFVTCDESGSSFVTLHFGQYTLNKPILWHELDIIQPIMKQRIHRRQK